MEPNGFFITALKNIIISKSLGRGLQLYKNIWITNKIDHLSHHFDDVFIKFVGELEAQFIYNAQAVCYSEFFYDYSNFSSMEFLNACIGKVKLSQLFLWLIKDNSINCEIGFLRLYNRHGLGKDRVESNLYSALYSNSLGMDEVVSYSEKELISTSNMIKSLNNNEPADPRIAGFEKKDNRIDRSLYYLQIARANHNLALKISSYCTFFEILFSSTPSEITHQLAERIAILLGDSTSERELIYANVKKAYGIRSKVLHGSSLTSKDITNLESISKECDEYARSVLLYSHKSPGYRSVLKLDNENFEIFFRKAIWSGKITFPT